MSALVLVSPELHRAAALAAVPERLVGHPEGLGLLADLHLSAGFVRFLQLLALSAGATALLGYFARMSLAVLTIAGGICFSFSSREGAVLHDMHLFWLTALLATSRCADAYALDAYRKPAPPSSLAYGVPLAFARLFLGLVYFFPGLHKLRVSGLAWIAPSNAIAHMHAKWLQNGLIPTLRVDHVPWLCGLGAALAIAFELSFVFLALGSRRTRLVALVLGLGFHLVTDRLFLIPFPSLWLCYVVLVDPRPRRTEPAPVPRATVAVGSAIAIAAFVQGARGQTNAWPFACYPTFAHVQADTMPDLVVETAGRRVTGREHQLRSQGEWGRVFRISGAYGDPANLEALRAHARAVLAVADLPADLRIYRVEVPTAPERWTEVPAGGVLLTPEGPTP